MRVLGVSCDFHDAAAALIIDGQIVAAAEQERFSRKKHDDTLPDDAVTSCLAIGGLAPDDLDAVVFHEKPLAVISRVVAARQRRGPAALRSFALEMPVLVRRNLTIGYRLEMMLRRLGATSSPTLRFGEHHLSHAASAFYPSPFPTAAILTIDGIGEWATATVGQGLGRRIDLLAEQRYPNSLGLLYSLATVWCGFEANDGEYKLMGLAPFGEPRFADALRELAELYEDGSMRVDGRATRWWGQKPGDLKRVQQLFGGPPRRSGESISLRDVDLARSVQEFIEEAVLRMAVNAHEMTGERNLCLAGGVALNCVANGRLLRHGPFDKVWVQPAAGDAGSAIGAALWFWHDECGGERERLAQTDGTVQDAMRTAELGPRFAPEEVAAWLDSTGVDYLRVPDPDTRCELVAERLSEGAIVGWFEGGMEFGPRALGHRSLLADPRSTSVQQDLNVRVKGRESFRPFAPAVLWEDASDWFEIDAPSPYMLFTFQLTAERMIDIDVEPTDPFERVRVSRSQIPACTHVDGSARVQTVHADRSPGFHRLLTAFRGLTGCPVLLNTSFNRAGEPVVCSPQDALSSARAAGLDLLVIEDCLIFDPSTLSHDAAERSGDR